MTTVRRALKGVFDAVAHNVIMRTVPRTHILLACMPKSGSTFLSRSISRIPGFRHTMIAHYSDRAEQEINFSVALRKSKYQYIAQQHVRYNARTAEAIETFQLTPVVLVRDIFDCVVSVRDHWRQESYRTPTAFVSKDHLEMDDEELDRMIVQMVIPWYINFYVSWTRCDKALWLRYEDVIVDPADAIRRILDAAGRGILTTSRSRPPLKDPPLIRSGRMLESPAGARCCRKRRSRLFENIGAFIPISIFP